MSLIVWGGWYDNEEFSEFVPANTNWNLLSAANVTNGTFTPLTPTPKPLFIQMRTVAAAGNADGSPFYVLGKQSATVAPVLTRGYMISGSGQHYNRPYLPALYFKLTVSTDILQVILGY